MSLDLARTPQCAARFSIRVLAVLQHLSAVYEDVLHSNRVLMRVLESRAVGYRRRIEHHNIGKHSLLEKPSMIEPEIIRRQAAQPSNRFLERDHFFFAHILAQQARKISISSRMC